MKILSDNETALLIGDLSKITLPEGIELYVSMGIPQIFQRISYSTDADIRRDWLYLPLGILGTIKQKIINIPGDTVDSINEIEPLSCENFFLFPIFTDQQVDIILVSKKKNLGSFKKEIIQCLLTTCRVYKEKNQKYGESHDKFIQTVTENPDSIIGLTKSILNLLVKNIPRSCAGYYSDEQSKLSRRMIVGDLSKFDYIPPYIIDEEKDTWEKAVKQDLTFIPAINLLNEAQFLVNPPLFLSVHRGLKSNCPENIISVLIPGNTDLSAVYFLKAIIEMTGKLSESQFLNSVSIMDYYKKYMLHTNIYLTPFILLEKMFTLLNKQLRITRVLLFEEENTIEISFSKDGVYNAFEKSSLKLLPQIKEEFAETNMLRKTNVENCYENYSLNSHAEVQTEFIYKINMPNNSIHYLAVGTSRRIEVLEMFKQFIDDAVEAFVKCCSCLYMQSALDDSKRKEKTYESRLYLTYKLSIGYFHQLFSKMTVLLGNIENTKKLLAAQEQKDDTDKLLKYLVAIENNADLVDGYIDVLHDLTHTDNNYYTNEIEASEMLKKLPRILEGYLHYINITKNVSLRIDVLTHTKPWFFVFGIDVDDIIIPVILSIADAAVQDGTIALEAHKELGGAYIKISLHNSLINNVNIIKTIAKAFDGFELQNVDDDSFTIGDTVISTIISEDSTLSVKIQCKQKSISHNTKIVREQNEVIDCV